ncbi:MAG: rhomboid family intramembrane serine protease [Pseudomonadota bacterium]
MFRLLLLSVSIIGIYQGQALWRKGGRERAGYAFMLIADGALALAAWLVLANEEERQVFGELLSFVAIGAFVFLVVVPPLLRDLAGRAVARDRVDLAIKVLDVCELLQPGMGGRHEREVLETVREVQAGRTEQVLAGLREKRASDTDSRQRRELDERIIYTLLYARRWQEAVECFESAFMAIPSQVQVQLLVELVRAYGELGDLDRAAELLDWLERSPTVHRPVLALLLLRARAVFLAFMGRAQDVEALMSSAGPLGGMPGFARAYWIGIARLHAGDRNGAHAALTDAIRLAGRDVRARQVAAETLAVVYRATTAGPPSFSNGAADLADRVVLAWRNENQASPSESPNRDGQAIPRPRVGKLRQAPVTLSLIAANALVAFVVTLALGTTESPGVLADAGANVREAVRTGEWWRLCASTFLHVGTLHLLVNMYALWALGRLAEQLLGSLRFFAVYCLAGIGGSVASFLFGSGSISAGASGAVFGLLGAAIAELASRRDSHSQPLRHALLGNLIFLAIMNLAMGLLPTIGQLIDQSAHVGGLVTGALLLFVLSPRSSFGASAAGKAVSVAFAMFAVLAIVYSIWGVSGRFASNDWTRRSVGQVSVEIPQRWIPMTEDTVLDPKGSPVRTLTTKVVAWEPAGTSAGTAADDTNDPVVAARELALSIGRESGAAQPVAEPTSAKTPGLPGWIEAEFVLLVEAEGGTGRETYRQLVMTRFADSRGIALVLISSENQVGETKALAGRIMESVL